MDEIIQEECTSKRRPREELLGPPPHPHLIKCQQRKGSRERNQSSSNQAGRRKIQERRVQEQSMVRAIPGCTEETCKEGPGDLAIWRSLVTYSKVALLKWERKKLTCQCTGDQTANNLELPALSSEKH